MWMCNHIHSLCACVEQMIQKDSTSLYPQNLNNLAAIKEEIPIALSAAADPANLVLDSLQGFYTIRVTQLDGKKDSCLLGLRRTCIMLMECLSLVLATLDMDFSSNVISDVKQRAKAIAEEWKQKLVNLDLDASNGNSLEAHAFLQLIATFGISSDYDQEVLYKMIPMVSRRQQTADLCHTHGLSERMPGVIDVLINNGTLIDSFELIGKYSPVLLLKSDLTEARKATSRLHL